MQHGAADGVTFSIFPSILASRPRISANEAFLARVSWECQSKTCTRAGTGSVKLKLRNGVLRKMQWKIMFKFICSLSGKTFVKGCVKPRPSIPRRAIFTQISEYVQDSLCIDGTGRNVEQMGDPDPDFASSLSPGLCACMGS